MHLDGVLFLLIIVQLVFSGIAALYFYRTMRGKGSLYPLSPDDTRKELDQLNRLRRVSLTTPLAEQTRPKKLTDLVGQERNVLALQAALCGPNPQHVIIYGSPGVGKTAAARLVLEEARKHPDSPFQRNAKFVEIDATTLRFDERSFADPLMGSVHDPIYQGAGAYGSAGVPQPKPGAVTKAHGGVLFIDEIGELHPMQMNKLLKVLEDRVVYFQSSYYNENNRQIPDHIHDVFRNGLPADFRLVGATTRSPEEIPPALRSRCTEIFFEDLNKEDIIKIAENCIRQVGFSSDKEICSLIGNYAQNGRDAVNIVQRVSSVAVLKKRDCLTKEDLEWVLETGHYQPLPNRKVGEKSEIGVINGLAVYGADRGALLPIEVWAKKVEAKGKGFLRITGIVEEEEVKGQHSNLKRKSNARSSVENVLTAVENMTGISMLDYDVHINFPGGGPVDGPSAGVAMFCAVYSAIYQKKIQCKFALTGEIGLRGEVLPVGGVRAKIAAAKEAGAVCVFIPKENWQESFDKMDIQVRCVSQVTEILEELFEIPAEKVSLEKPAYGIQPLCVSTASTQG